MQKEENKQSRFWYFFDPLCGWCYGFSPVMQKIHEKYSNDFAFEVISGGMVLGDRVGPIGQMKDFLINATKQVEERSGVKFGERYMEQMEEGTMILSSFEPAKALTVLKVMFPNEKVNLASEVQKAIYFEGKPPVERDSYLSIVEHFNGDLLQFEKLYEDSEAEERTEEEFEIAQKFGIQGYPALVLEHNGQYFMVAKGFMPFDMVDDIVQKVLAEN